MSIVKPEQFADSQNPLRKKIETLLKEENQAAIFPPPYLIFFIEEETNTMIAQPFRDENLQREYNNIVNSRYGYKVIAILSNCDGGTYEFLELLDQSQETKNIFRFLDFIQKTLKHGIYISVNIPENFDPDQPKTRRKTTPPKSQNRHQRL